MKKPTILMMSDNPMIHTGQAVVLRETSLRLHATGKYNIVVAGWGYNGYPHALPYTLLPASPHDFGREGFPQAGIPGLEQIIENVKPDILWTNADIWMVNYITQLKNRRSFKWVAHTPIDGDPVPAEWIPWFKDVDQLVMETKYGLDEVNRLDPSINPKYVYMGVNAHDYFPMLPPVKANIKKTIAWAAITDRGLEIRNGVPEDTFIVGSFARNQPRKNWDKVLKAFKIFAKDKPNVRLWPHTAPVDQGYNLVQLAKMLGIADKMMFTPNYNILNGLGPRDLNSLMNMWDVHLMATQGEGFGIPILETMSSGVPQIVPDFSSHVEFAKEGGLLIPIDREDDTITGMPHPVERAIPRPTIMASLLEKIYTDKDLRIDLGKKARIKAASMTWGATVEPWAKIMDDVLTAGSKAERLDFIKI